MLSSAADNDEEITADLAANFAWAETIARAYGYVVGGNANSPEGLDYEVISVGFSGDDVCVTLKLIGQPRKPLRDVIIKTYPATISWAKESP